MPSALNYRRRLLAIVNAFLDPADADNERAHRLVHRLYHDPWRGIDPMTLDEVVWGGLISELTDSEFYDRADYLRETRETLLHGSSVLHRAYVNYDWRPAFSDVERDWYKQLDDLGAWLESNQFQHYEADGAEYTRRAELVKSLASRTPPPHHVGEEALHHFILRTASAVLTEINPWRSSRLGYLAAESPLTLFHWDPDNPDDRYRPPDAADSVAWARRALRAVSLQGWVWITWQITTSEYLISLH